MFISIQYNYPEFRRWRIRGIISIKKSISLRVWKKIVEFSSLLSSLIVHSDINNATRGYYFFAESNILLYYISIDRPTNTIHILSFYVWINVDGLNSRIALELCCQIIRLYLIKGEEKIEDVCMRANEHLIGLETDFISIFRASRKLSVGIWVENTSK